MNFLKTLSKVDKFEKAGQGVLVWTAKTELFENDYVTTAILSLLQSLIRFYIYYLSIFVIKMPFSNLSA